MLKKPVKGVKFRVSAMCVGAEICVSGDRDNGTENSTGSQNFLYLGELRLQQLGTVKFVFLPRKYKGAV